MPGRQHQLIKFRYRGYLTIIRHYDDGTCAATTIRTGGTVTYYQNFWSVVMLDRILNSIDEYIS